MAATVRVWKGLLTKRSHMIQVWLENSAQLIVEPAESESAKQECISDARLALKVCCDYIDLIESSMTKLANTFDAIDEHSVEEEKQLDRYAQTAQDLIVKLHVHNSELECTMSNYERDDPRWSEAHGTAEVMTTFSLSKPPRIPIPIFSGKRRAWDKF
ncbi:unnamed protein product [Heligmosomoides polygyrus]|uniref:Rx_N domain-containing protein n=1 Tax=Heligmosomoides polygyrus TaxID=6339 RepID=A0A183G2U2_HELPZ|nr:unnamed protein product [Heligmosomoides polygyrus]